MTIRWLFSCRRCVSFFLRSPNLLAIVLITFLIFVYDKSFQKIWKQSSHVFLYNFVIFSLNIFFFFVCRLVTVLYFSIDSIAFDPNYCTNIYLLFITHYLITTNKIFGCCFFACVSYQKARQPLTKIQYVLRIRRALVVLSSSVYFVFACVFFKFYFIL